MNKFLLTLAIYCGGLACGLADSPGTGVPGVFGDWLAAQKHASDVKVEFSITKTMPALKEPVKAVGRFWNYADGRFRWETGKPATTVLVFDGVTLQSWDAAENQWHKLNPNSRGMRLWMEFLGGQNLTEEGLLKDFLITASESKMPLAGVILQPKSSRVRRDLKQIELKFNASEKRMVQMLIAQGDGGSQTMDFGAPKRMTAADRAVVPSALQAPGDKAHE
jgi:outer membrane lipoprotein-sorting protein